MKKQLILSALSILMFWGAQANSPAKTKVYTVDLAQSKVLWVGKKISGQHNGAISISNSEVNVSGKNVTGVSVKMDMNSITCEDLKDASWNQKLVGHLKSDDFFGVDKFPASTFEATDIKLKNGNEYVVTGKLTVKGITNEISFSSRIDINNEKLTASGTATIDRTKFGIRYGSGSFFSDLGDKAINDNFEITFNLVAKEKTK